MVSTGGRTELVITWLAEEVGAPGWYPEAGGTEQLTGLYVDAVAGAPGVYPSDEGPLLTPVVYPADGAPGVYVEAVPPGVYPDDVLTTGVYAELGGLELITGVYPRGGGGPEDGNGGGPEDGSGGGPTAGSGGGCSCIASSSITLFSAGSTDLCTIESSPFFSWFFTIWYVADGTTIFLRFSATIFSSSLLEKVSQNITCMQLVK